MDKAPGLTFDQCTDRAYVVLSFSTAEMGYAERTKQAKEIKKCITAFSKNVLTEILKPPHVRVPIITFSSLIFFMPSYKGYISLCNSLANTCMSYFVFDVDVHCNMLMMHCIIVSKLPVMGNGTGLPSWGKK